MTILLTEIYDIVNKNRGAAAEGWIRPTIGEHFVTNKNFEQIEKIMPIRLDWDFTYSVNVKSKNWIDGWEQVGTTTTSVGRIISPPAHPMLADTKGTVRMSKDSTWHIFLLIKLS